MYHIVLIKSEHSNKWKVDGVSSIFLLAFLSHFRDDERRNEKERERMSVMITCIKKYIYVLQKKCSMNTVY